MANESSDIEYLAEVFLSGFQISQGANSDDVCIAIEADMKSLSRTLDDSEAAAFERTVKKLVVERFGE